MSIEAADTGMWPRLFLGISSPRAAEGPKAAFLGWASVVCHVGIVFGGGTWGLQRGGVSGRGIHTEGAWCAARANSSCEIHVHFSVFYISLFSEWKSDFSPDF